MANYFQTKLKQSYIFKFEKKHTGNLVSFQRQFENPDYYNALHKLEGIVVNSTRLAAVKEVLQRRSDAEDAEITANLGIGAIAYDPTVE